jgi:hypothetical protein
MQRRGMWRLTVLEEATQRRLAIAKPVDDIVPISFVFTSCVSHSRTSIGRRCRRQLDMTGPGIVHGGSSGIRSGNQARFIGRDRGRTRPPPRHGQPGGAGFVQQTGSVGARCAVTITELEGAGHCSVGYGPDGHSGSQCRVKVHIRYVGQVNCGPAYETHGRADDAAALTDEAHAIRVDELLGREPEGPTIAEQCRSATGSRRAWQSRSPSSGAMVALGARACAHHAGRPTD